MLKERRRRKKKKTLPVLIASNKKNRNLAELDRTNIQFSEKHNFLSQMSEFIQTWCQNLSLFLHSWAEKDLIRPTEPVQSLDFLLRSTVLGLSRTENDHFGLICCETMHLAIQVVNKFAATNCPTGSWLIHFDVSKVRTSSAFLRATDYLYIISACWQHDAIHKSSYWFRDKTIIMCLCRRDLTVTEPMGPDQNQEAPSFTLACWKCSLQ